MLKLLERALGHQDAYDTVQGRETCRRDCQYRIELDADLMSAIEFRT